MWGENVRLDEAVVSCNKEYNEAGGHALLQRCDKGYSENVWEKNAKICTERPPVLAICTLCLVPIIYFDRRAGLR